MAKRVREKYKLRDADWKAYVEAKTNASFEVYRKLRHNAGHVQRKARMAYETNWATSAVVNPKKLFGHIQQKKALENPIRYSQEMKMACESPTHRPKPICLRTRYIEHFDLTLSHQFLSSSRKPNQCLQWCLLLIP